MFSGNHFRAGGLQKMMIQEQDCDLYPSQLIFGTKGQDLTIVLSASALLCPLLTAFVTDPSLEITCSCILFFSFSFPPSMFQVLCKFESWVEMQKSEIERYRDMQKPFC